MSARIFALFAAALVVAAAPAWSQPADTGEPVDPPDRVGRLSLVEGAVQQRSGDDQQWSQANANYPVTDGFAVATQDGRAEIEVGSLALRVGANSELDINTLTDTAAVVTLVQGEINLRLGRLTSAGHIQVVTPRGIIDIVAAGQYHLDAGTADAPTVVGTFSGKAQIERDSGTIDVAPGQVTLIAGDANSGPQISTAQLQPDDLDNWAAARDRPAPPPPPAVAGSAPPPALSPDMTGAAELGAYGSWSSDPDYGSVWYPAAVPAGWAPYSYGHWAWVSPWGWTWIDDQPWGFAPFHYGRWAHRERGWCWVPGVAVAHPVYAPALVVFVGSPGARLFVGAGVEGVAWFPLAPREVFVPSYRTSVAYVRNVNVTNVNVTNIHITRINNQVVVNNSGSNVSSSFANRRFVTAVPRNDFGTARPVHQVAVAAPASLTTGSQTVSHSPGVAPPPNAARAQNGGPARGQRSQGASFSGTSNPVHIFPTRPPGRGGTPAPANASVAPSATGSQTPENRRAQHALPPVPPAHGNAVVNRTPGTAPVATPNAAPQPSKNLGTVKPASPPSSNAPSRDHARDNRNRAPQGAPPSNPAGAAAVTPHAPPPNGGQNNRQFKSTAVPQNQAPRQPPRGNPPPPAAHAAPPPQQQQQRNAVHNNPPPVNRPAPQAQGHEQNRGGEAQKGGQGPQKDPNKPQ